MRVKEFLRKKDIVISPKRYGIDALSQMAQAVFASLLIGLIFKTVGEQGQNLLGEYRIFAYFTQLGSFAMKQVGAAIGVAVAWALKAPPLVLFTSAVTGAFGAGIGGEAAALVSAIVGAEFGKAVSKETKVDILVTPGVTLLVGGLTATFIGPGVKMLMSGIGLIIMKATELQPFFMGIIVSVIVGLVLTSPLSSTALCIMLNLSGISAGAAAVGCCAQMVGFAATGYILLPPTLSSIIIAPIATCILETTNTPAGAGMGTCGFVGQIFTFTDMGINTKSIVSVALLHFIFPVCFSLFVDGILRKKGKIKQGDYSFEI
ncbi:MAG: PTS sugar transporter subunit IIC [Lachnospiraceae bacterium]|nr:PTS sugar transporter subunit IIC [Lachnospiraceae bacterium]